jgi:hypothetical protein
MKTRRIRSPFPNPARFATSTTSPISLFSSSGPRGFHPQRLDRVSRALFLCPIGGWRVRCGNRLHIFQARRTKRRTCRPVCRPKRRCASSGADDLFLASAPRRAWKRD